MISEDESLHGRKAKRLKLDEDQEQKSSYIQEWHAKQSFYVPDSDKNTTISETCDSGIGSSLYPPSELGIEVTSGKLIINFLFSGLLLFKGWRMVKSETCRDAEILVRNLSPRLFGEKFRDSTKVKANHEKTRLRDLPKTLPRFRDPAKIFRDPSFSRYHSPPLICLFCGYRAPDSDSTVCLSYSM